MSFERAHAYAARGGKADDDLEDLAPGRMTRTAELRPGRMFGLIQRKASGPAALTRDAELAIGRASTSAGLPLPEALRRKFEAVLGADLSAVRLHTGDASATAAEAIGAKAYTIGQDIHFARDADPADELLLAHEVAHTVQQHGAAATAPLAISSPADHAEHEADRAADAMLTGGAFTLDPAPAPAIAARKADEQAGPGAVTQLNTSGYLSAPTQVHSGPDPKSTLLTTLPGGGWIHIIGSNGSFYVVSYDGTKQGYIDHNDLDVDGTPTAYDHDPGTPDPGTAQGAAGAPADPAHAADAKQTPGQRYRSAIQKALDYWKGAKEGDAKFKQFRSDKSLESARKTAGKDHKTFTTCIEFLTQVQADAARDAHAKQVVKADSRFAVADERKKLPAGAWHPASPNMSERPKAGDVFYLTFAKNVKGDDGKVKFGKGDFSHVGYFNGLEKQAPTSTSSDANASAGEPVELWHTVDGGQGTSTRYDADGNMVGNHGTEEIKAVDRYYLPAKNLIAGEKIQGDSDARTLLGWIDIEKLVSSEEPPEST